MRPPMLKSMDEQMTGRMLELLGKIMSKKDAKQHFNAPVDWVKLKILDYPNIIKEPMDLGTVKRKLEADRDKPYHEKYYQFAEEFAYDVRLVWKNAFIFNSMKDAVYKAAKSLAEMFEEKLHGRDIYTRAEMLGPPCPLKVRCQLLLSDIRRNPLSEWFRRDKDWKKFANYVSYISSGTPMDLDQVTVRLHNGEYDVAGEGGESVFSAKTFARDMSLIWQNAMEFNKEGVFWLCPKLLKYTFERRMEILEGAPVPGERGKRREEREGWPTFERKRDLARKCVRLAMQGNDVALLIRSSCPAAVKVSEPFGFGVQQAVVDLDVVDEGTFAKAEAQCSQMAPQHAFIP